MSTMTASSLTTPPPRDNRRWGWFQNRPVAVKILTAVIVVGAIGAATNVLAITRIGQVDRDASRIYVDGLKPLPPLTEFRRSFMASRVDVLNVAVSDTDAERADYQTKVTADSTAANAALRDYAPHASDPAAFADLQSQWRTYEQARDNQVMPAAVAGDTATVDRLRESVTGPLQDRITELVQTLEDKQLARADAIRTAAAASASSARTLVLAFLVAGLAIGIALGFAVARLIVRPLSRVRDVLDALADGDLTGDAAVVSRAEVGAMASALRTALTRLRETVEALHESATTVGASSEELSAASSQIAASAEETSAQSQVVAAAAEQVSRNIQTVATGTEEMGASILEISTNASEAAKVAATAVDASTTAQETVHALGDASTEVGAVIKVITTIAEQTNLLALNATIEAARAGDAGKGFAVVASEVKDLAQETARATEDIAHRIEAIQASTAHATSAIAAISQIIQQIHDFQTTIASAVEEQTATTAEMNRNVSEAAIATTDIAANITSVADAANTTTTGVTQTDQAAANLAQLSMDLLTRVNHFRW
jgi:methyl-accepting chemotaxis protein